MDLNLVLIRAIFSIVIIDLVLSGDNAVVIGMASRRLPADQRRRAILFGAIGAIGLRVIFTAMVTLLLDIPLLQAVGGVVLIWIAFKLLRDSQNEHNVREGVNLFDAIRTIIVADVIMSLDNILAVAGTAHGDLRLLLFGLALSMPIIMFGSNLVALLMNRIPWLVYLGSAILAYTAGEMIFQDDIVGRILPHSRVFEWAVIIAIVVGTLGGAYWLNRRQRVADTNAPSPPAASTTAAESEVVGPDARRHSRSK